MAPTISVIIPTYKRQRTLLQTLASLQEQTVKDFEILVMDNASELAIERAVADFNATAKVRARYVAESRTGVHYARNTAAQLASGELLLYTDDDMSFGPKWVEAYRDAFTRHPEMAAASGPVRPIWEEQPPQWLLEFMAICMARDKSFGFLSLMEPHDSFQLAKDGYFYSCNMALSKRVLVELGGFNPENTAGLWIGDGETGLNLRIWARGDLIGYVPEALTYHHIPASRMTVEYFCRRWANQGAADSYTRLHREMPTRYRLIQSFAWRLKSHWRLWLQAYKFRGQTDPKSLQLQMDAAKTQAETKYLLQVLWSKRFRQLVLKENWLDE